MDIIDTVVNVCALWLGIVLSATGVIGSAWTFITEDRDVVVLILLGTMSWSLKLFLSFL
jgi:hypothetical protein